MKNVVELQNVFKTYHLGDSTLHAVNSASLTIKKGELLAILGPSGSGKSTLMHIMGLLDSPTKGRIKLMGSEVSDLTQRERAYYRNKHVGFVFQQFNLLSKSSALDNVELPLLYAGIDKDERKKISKKVLESVGLGERLQNEPSQLSGGQQQRVAISRAIVNEPDIIFADEPTGNLDSKSGKEIIKILKDLNKKGNTIVIVTHEKRLAKIARRIVRIKDGKIISDKKV